MLNLHHRILMFLPSEVGAWYSCEYAETDKEQSEWRSSMFIVACSQRACSQRACPRVTSPCDAKIRIPLGRWGRVKKSPCIIKYVGGFFFREWHKGDWHFCVKFLSMCTPTIVARQAWIKIETSLNQNPRRLESKLRQAQNKKIETSLNQNPRRLELKLRQAQIRIETGLEFFRERLKKKLLSLRRFLFEPLPIFFWAFGDFFLSLRGFCFKPLRILFWACVRNVSGRTHFVTKPHPFYAHSVPVPVWPSHLVAQKEGFVLCCVIAHCVGRDSHDHHHCQDHHLLHILISYTLNGETLISFSRCKDRNF